MKPPAEPSHVVEITAFYNDKLLGPRTPSGYANCIIWYRAVSGDNKYANLTLYVAGYTDPNKLLNDILNHTTDYVRSAWFMVEAGNAMRATRMTTAEAVAQRLKG